MTNAYVVNGTLTGGQTVRLDEPIPSNGGRVRVTVEVIEPATPSRRPLQEYLAELRKRQAERGHVPMTAEEIQASVRAERDSWGE